MKDVAAVVLNAKEIVKLICSCEIWPSHINSCLLLRFNGRFFRFFDRPFDVQTSGSVPTHIGEGIYVYCFFGVFYQKGVNSPLRSNEGSHVSHQDELCLL